jgi:integrase
VTPRKASLRVAHQQTCPLVSRTSIASVAKGAGCSCKPAYYVLWRDRSGATLKSTRVRDRRLADKMLTQQQAQIDVGNVGWGDRRKDIEFSAWLELYRELLDERGVKEETKRSYDKTLEIAKNVFGHVPVRAIGEDEMRAFYAKVKHTKAATIKKYLRELGACLQAAVPKYAERNPVPEFRKSMRKVLKGNEATRKATGSPPFTDAEIGCVCAELAGKPVYLALFTTLVETGARIGEVIAADWSDVNLLDGTFQITGTWNPIDGKTSPKDGDARTVHLTPGARKALEWWAARHEPDVSGPLFPSATGGRLAYHYAYKVVKQAFVDAGIDQGDRKVFHSLRATYAQRMVRAGRHPEWIRRELGHSELALTLNTYGEWTEEQMLAEAAKSAQ